MSLRRLLHRGYGLGIPAQICWVLLWRNRLVSRLLRISPEFGGTLSRHWVAAIIVFDSFHMPTFQHGEDETELECNSTHFIFAYPTECGGHPVKVVLNFK